MNSFMAPMQAAEIDALSTTGLDLPEGNHTIYFYWINPHKATTIAQLRANWWEILQNPETFQNHTAQLEYVILEIKNLRSNPSKEIKIPNDIQGATWYPQYQETPHKLALPEGKIFGVTKRVAGIPSVQLIAQGQYLQAIYGDVNNNSSIPYNRTWITQRAYHKGQAEIPYQGRLEAGQMVTLEKAELNCRPGDIISIHKGYSKGVPANLRVEYSIPQAGAFRFTITNTSDDAIDISDGNFYAGYFGSVDEEAQKFYEYSSRRGHVTTSEICENGIPFEYVERIYKRVYELQVERDGVKDVLDTNLIADYFAGMYGYGTDAMAQFSSYSERRALLSSPDLAKKAKPNENESLYYSNRAYEYRHRLVSGYLDGVSRLLDATRIYGHIANLEKQYIAMDDRKVLTFGWVGFEGVQSEVEKNATDQRLPLKGGDLIRTSRPEASFEQLKYEAFFSLLIGDFYTLWDDGGIYGTDINNFGLAHIGGASAWKNQWQPTNGEMAQYDPANPTHPQPIGGQYHWSDSAAPGHNGAFCGAWLLSQAKDLFDKSLSYAKFSYSINNASQPGYFDGSEPVKGLSGTSEVSRFGVANPGQCNIINQEEHRKPIVLVGRGTKGKVAIIIHPHAGLTERVTYRIDDGKLHVIQNTGPAVGLYRIL
jgi:hypothetical protein